MYCTAHNRAWCFRQDCVKERRRNVAEQAAARTSRASSIGDSVALSDDVVQQVVAAAAYDEIQIHGATFGPPIESSPDCGRSDDSSSYSSSSSDSSGSSDCSPTSSD